MFFKASAYSVELAKVVLLLDKSVELVVELAEAVELEATSDKRSGNMSIIVAKAGMSLTS